MLHNRTCKRCKFYNEKARVCNRYNTQCSPWSECGGWEAK